MAVQTDPPVILAASPDNVVFDKDPGASYSDELLVVGTAIPNSTITVYDGSTLLGTATANSAGVWTYQTSSLTDGAHSFTATATVSGVTSAASSAFTQTITAGISNFSPLTDQWSAPILVGGQQYYVENANVNGNAPWAIKQLDSHTLRFELRPNDIWLDNDSHRSEISGGTVYSATSTIDLSYQFTVQPGFNDTSDSLAWQILGQFHADDNDATYQSIEGGSPPLAVHLTGANGYGEGDYLAIEAFYALPGQKEWTAATLPGDPLNSYLWVSSAPIVRGQPIDVHMEVNFQNNANGFLEVWINGQQVVDYHGPIGYGGGVYWKEGVYEGWSSNQTITVDYSNTVITAKPGAPLILTDVVNGNQVMLGGTSQANSVVSIYDGSTKLGTATASSNGSWFYQTSALSIGSHNLTATATDSAGNVGQASAIASATIAALTAPIITKVVTSAPSGATVTGTKITFTLTMNSVVSVTGTPTLLLNDGGTAVYSAGSGSNTLTFTYTVGANDSSVKGLAIVGADLPNGATIKDGNGIAALLTGASVQFPGVTIDAQPVKTPVFGDPVDNGNGTFTFTGTAGANTTVYFSTPYGVALGSAAVDSTGHWTFTSPTFAGNTWNSIQAYNVNSLGNVSAIGVENGAGFGSSSNLPPSPIITGNALVGSTVTLYGMVTPGYSITKVTIFDGTTQIGTATINSDNSWSFSTSTLANGVHNFTAKVTNASGTSAGSIPDLITVGTLTTGTDTTAPTVASLVAAGNGVTAGTGTIGVGSVVTLTMNLSEAVTVAGGTPTLTLNNGGTATYAGGSGSNALTFSYTVAAGQNTSDLAVTAFNLNAATVKDSAGNAASLAGAVTNPSGTLQIDTTAPTVSSVAASGTGITSGSGTLGSGKVVTLTVNLSEAVTVAGGTPTLTLNNGGTATYAGGSGSNALTFSYTVAAGQNTSDLAVTAFNLNAATVKDSAGNAASLAGAVTNPSGTLQIDTTAPTVSSVAASGTGITSGSGTLGSGKVVTLTVNLSEAVTVAGGTPTLTLNNGGTATYAGGSGSNALTFSYTVAAGQNTSDLAVTAFNLNAATVKGSAGNAASLAGAVTNPSGTLQIDTTAPTVSSVAASGTGITSGSGTLGSGKVVTLTVNLSEAVTVAGGTPTLTLNNGGTATYAGGSGSNALTFSYTVAAGQNTSDLAVTAFNLNAATVKDSAGNAASLAGAVTNPSGTLQIDTTAPTVSSVAASGTGITSGSGTLGSGKVVTLTVNLSEAVTVAGGTPTLTLNNGGTATYAGGSGSNSLTFSYTVAAGQNTSDLAVTAFNLNAATVKGSAGNAASLAGAVTNPSGTLQIDTTAPTVSSVAASGTGITSGSGTLGSGKVVTLTVNLSEAVTVAGGTPTLTLNNGGTATYAGGSGSNALTFSYTVAAGQNTSDLAVTAFNLNAATVKDSAGNAASLAGAVTNPSGTLQIDTTAPTVSSVAASGTGITSGSGTLGSGKVVTLTVNLSEAVTVAGGTPTLTLNNGGTATYAGGSGSNALTFSYTVAAGQSTSDLAVTAFNLNAATVKDSAGNAASLAGAVTNPSGTLQIDTTAPTVSSVAASGTGITSGSGTLGSGKVVTLTVNLSEAVTVAGGTPTLTLNNGGTATYAGGSGSNALTFSYTVAAADLQVSALAITRVVSNGATVLDVAGNAANLLGALATLPNLSVDPSITIEALGSTRVVLLGGNYHLDSIATSTGPILKYAGSAVIAANWGSWSVIGAEQVTGGGYDVVWKDSSSGHYSVWSTDSSGNFVATLGSAPEMLRSDAALKALESTLQQDLNGDGTITAPVVVGGGNGTTIEALGSTSVVLNGGNYHLNSVGTSTGPILKYAGSKVIAANWGSWSVIGAEQVTGGGYDVVWKDSSSGHYSVWSTDSSGNFVATLGSAPEMLRSDAALKALESTLQQDLNGDGTITAPVVVGGGNGTTIEALGSTSVVLNGGNYHLNSVGTSTGPILKYAGSAVIAANWGSWSVIGAEQVTGGGYDVVWKDSSSGHYSVWSTDSSGNFVATLGSAPEMLRSDAALKALESTLQQDLNGDGTITAPVVVGGGNGTTIEALGSTSVVLNGGNYHLNSVGTSTGPILKYAGSAVIAANWGSWSVIGAEQVTGGGYDVVWKDSSSGYYSVWSTDSSGNFVATLGSAPEMLGGDASLKALESTLHQDLNGDGVIVLSGSGTIIEANSLIIGSGASVELVGSYSGAISFAGATGTLVLDQSTEFSGTLNGQLTTTNFIDLRDITAGANASVSYTGNNSPGTLTVSDGTNSANFTLSGNYSLGNFIVSSDGNGGTTLVDPPLSTDQGSAALARSADAASDWLDSIDSKIALWLQHCSSAFPSSPFNTSTSGNIGISDVGANPALQLATSAMVQQHQQNSFS
ncbi:heparin lyase I family protein [Bradyrhizobium symbiodeficiens]|uniref:Heparin lyase I family protein n=1 Tax=Bradyrhizobium symbiodeficiens TaxID=1404367 RepID=A0ABX5VZ76_9BRAD|nr:heparin lyase I family protein [Bradyrhizobium symbiodeficiens]QDF36263.1 hypothetical protein FJN17_01075 [Bradyrhizobium symbiodeficiens]